MWDEWVVDPATDGQGEPMVNGPLALIWPVDLCKLDLPEITALQDGQRLMYVHLWRLKNVDR